MKSTGVILLSTAGQLRKTCAAYNDERMQTNFELSKKSVPLLSQSSLDIRRRFQSFFLWCTTLFIVLMIL